MPLTLTQSTRLARSVRLAGSLLALAVFLGVALMALKTRSDAIDTATGRNRLLARVLEDQATRTIDSAALALTTVADAFPARSPVDLGRIGPMLDQTVMALPHLRAAALLDDRGRVLVSTSPRDVGRQVSLNDWGAMPAAGRTALLRLQAGRGLSDVDPSRSVGETAVLPLVLKLGTGGTSWTLLALINPDAIANHQQGTMELPGQAAALFSYDGQLLAGTTGMPNSPGTWERGHHLFQEALQSQDHGDWRGKGFQGGRQLVSYRVSRTRPMVVVVEQSEHAALASWRTGLWWDACGLLVLELLVAGATLVTLRALRARASVRKVLDDAHDRLAASEREMAVVLRSVQELIFRTDAHGHLSFVNARWDMVTAEAPDSVLGQLVSGLAIEGDRARVQRLFAVDSRGGVRSDEATFLTARGEARRLALAVVPLLSGGVISGFAGSAVDVTDRFAAESRLQHQLDLVVLLLELSPQPTSMVDRDGLIVTVNRAWEQFTGLSREHVIGRPVRPPMPEADEEPSTSDWVPFEAVRGRNLLRYETQIRDRDGDSRDVVLSKVVVPGDRRQSAGILFTLTDVSEFRRAERAIREAKEAAEEASRVKSEFIANVSHELRTPLQSIIGYSELGRTRGSATAPTLAMMFGEIHASGHRMLALVNDLLDVSKLESSVGTFDFECCDLRAPVAHVVRELEALLASRGLRVELNQSGSPLVVRVDPLRFQQVMRNVLANAIRFSPKGGVIEVRTRATPESEAHVAILDRGPGIPPNELERIFQAFVQSSATKDGSGGTGLGLAISRKIMAILQGRIYARNRLGGGSEFHVDLPLRVVEDL